MVLPLIPLLLFGTGALTGVSGAITGALGAKKIKGASADQAGAVERHEACRLVTQDAVASTNGRALSYGQVQQSSHTAVVLRMRRFLDRHQMRSTTKDTEFLSGVTADAQQVAPYSELGSVGLGLLQGAASAAALGAATAAGIPAAVTAVGTASTGAAIGGLSGAAAQSATMAWLGGGALSAGGGGVALGAAALSAVVAGPVVMVGGLAVNVQGEKAATRATTFVAKVDVDIEKQLAFRGRLKAVDDRIAELTTILGDVACRSVTALDRLEAVDFDRVAHADLFSAAMSHARAVAVIVSTPVLTQDATVNPDTDDLVMTYGSAS